MWFYLFFNRILEISVPDRLRTEHNWSVMVRYGFFIRKFELSVPDRLRTENIWSVMVRYGLIFNKKIRTVPVKLRSVNGPVRIYSQFRKIRTGQKSVPKIRTGLKSVPRTKLCTDNPYLKTCTTDQRSGQPCFCR